MAIFGLDGVLIKEVGMLWAKDPSTGLIRKAGGGEEAGDVRLFASDPGEGWLSENALVNFNPANAGILSTDLGEWQQATNPYAAQDSLTYHVAFGGGIWIAVGANNWGNSYVARFTDGTTWTPVSNPFATYVTFISHGNGQFIVFGQLPQQCWVSTDGLNWTAATTPPTKLIFAAHFANDRWIAAGGDGSIFTSTNGLVWTQQTSNVPSGNLRGVTYGNGRWVALGEASSGASFRGGYSDDGINWTNLGTGLLPGGVYDIHFANGRFVAVGNNSLVAASTNGLSWTVLPVVGMGNLTDVVYGDGLWLAASSATGAGGFSRNGDDWVVGNSKFPNITKLAFGQHRFLGGGASSRLGSVPAVQSGIKVPNKPVGKEAFTAYTRLAA